jgi:RHH-type proline utilization regulon transcriptional repressor/proline dehydrogenase/delta 1-pyrroline-5-carboxylate dehydrogenase
MAEMGLVVRNYVPVGPLIVGMAYLVRRIMENSSQVGVLTIMRSHKRVGTLTPPWQIHQEQKSKGTIKRDLSVEDLSARFINITPVRLYVQSDLIFLQNKFKEITSLLNKFYPNQFLQNGKRISIHSSSDQSIKVGEILFAGKEDANKAIEIVSKDYHQGKWSKFSWFERAHCLNRAALLMLAQRLELSALISYEAGKTAHEALGDVDEAIDFLNFYAREEAKFYQRNSKSKDNEILSRGPFAVIAPWNFPLAIPCGMVAGALVAGNTVILKSAEQTPLIAQVLVDLLHQAGVPYEALIHLPGEGSEVGQVLVDSSDLAGFIFTGSKAVGEMIYQKASGRLYKNPMTEAMQPTRVITEMGGKNAIIVTANAELDETVSGIMYSAFGHAGQKCSACSRVIVSNKIKSKLIERLKQACGDLNVGRAFDFSTFVNPLIGAEDKTRVIENVKIAGREKNAKVVIDRSTENLPGNCIGPVVIEVTKDLAFSSESFAQKELFAPVLHIVGFDSLEEAIDLFNATSYALTGGIFSQSQDDIDYLSSHLECGNLYINRGITGARVAIEPFGGFKLSGTGPKAGGKNYLPTLHFLKNNNLVFHAKNEQGTDYQFPRCGVSKLSAARRQNKLSDAFLLIIKNFEVLFPGIYGEEKEVLAHFRKWMNDDFLEFKNGTHPNRKIPGQLSYNDHRLHSKSALVIGESDKPDITTLIKVASALLVGLGVTVASRNQNNYEWWNKVKTFLNNAGISKENFDVYFASEKVLLQAISDLEYTHVIFDSIDSKYFTEIKSMTKKISPHEAPKLMDFKKFLVEFIWLRSFAVNTMRHGAPLEIDVV